MLAWAPPVLWAAVLFGLSQISSVPSSPQFFFIPSDKVVHFALYFTLGALLARSRRRSGSGVAHAALVGIGAVYGLSDEWHQSFVPGRTSDAADWLADLAGVTVGYVLVALLGRRRATG